VTLSAASHSIGNIESKFFMPIPRIFVMSNKVSSARLTTSQANKIIPGIDCVSPKNGPRIYAAIFSQFPLFVGDARVKTTNVSLLLTEAAA
jgi:hypothetical protein